MPAETSQMMLSDLVLKCRSYRRFDMNVPIQRRTLEELVDLARLSPSGGNFQPLKFMVSSKPEVNDQIFSCLGWAGYLKDWPGPEANERPSGYVVILRDRTITDNPVLDHAIAAHTILLGATERYLGGCIVGSIQHEQLSTVLGVPDHFDILLTVALGKPVERVQLETAQDGNIRYWRDEEGIHHVPKRPLEEVLIN